MQSAPLRYRFDELKPYTLEVYGPHHPDILLWKHDSDQAFTPMARGDRLVLPEAPEAKADAPLRIVEVEHVIWTCEGAVRSVTRVMVEPA